MKAAMIGTWHVHTDGYAKDFCADPRCQLTAVWDADPEKANAFAEKYGCKAYTDLDTLYAEGDFDSVIICSATNKHASLLIQAAQQGKNIFTEKVLAITTKEAEEICDAVQKSGVKFVISYPHKTNPGLILAKQMVESGKLGMVTYARVRNAHNGSLANWLPPHFYDKEQCGGGAMMDLGAHPMYILLWLLGEPVKVSSAFTTVTGKPVEDNAVCILSYANGAIGVSETGFVSDYGNYVIEVIGTEGAVRIVDGKTMVASAATNNEFVAADLPEQAASPLNQWIQYVEENIPAPEFGVEEAVRLTRLMEAAYRAADLDICARY